MQGIPYREILGALLYLSTRTRPNIATTMLMFGKFQAGPAPKHWMALKHVVRYLKITAHMGIIIPHQAANKRLCAWSDSDWAHDQSIRLSRSGYTLMYNNAPILWSSKLLAATALSTTEAELFLHYLSASETSIRYKKFLVLSNSLFRFRQKYVKTI